MIRVVLDTNVLVSALLKPQGLEARMVEWIAKDKLIWCVSEPILSEYEAVLLRPKLKLNRIQVRRFLTLARNVSLLFHPSVKLSVSIDEADNRFLECAEAAGAAFC